MANAPLKLYHCNWSTEEIYVFPNGAIRKGYLTKALMSHSIEILIFWIYKEEWVAQGILIQRAKENFEEIGC